VAKLAANLSWLFTELPLIERFEAAAACGFRAVEILDPYVLPAADIAAALSAHGLDLILINVPAGDAARGERGFGARPGEQQRFADGIERALEYAAACRCPRIHVLSGTQIPGVTLATQEDTLVENLASASARCADAGITLLIEPLNQRDNPGYVLSSTGQALAILSRVARPNVSLQLDLYHTFVTEGDVERRAHDLRGRFAHVQLAGCPDRHEPDAGHLDAPRILDLLDADGYAGWIGLEYAPRTTTRAGLGWAAPYLQTATARS
jgi:hydroxypyruvate isomerase